MTAPGHATKLDRVLRSKCSRTTKIGSYEKNVCNRPLCESYEDAYAWVHILKQNNITCQMARLTTLANARRFIKRWFPLHATKKLFQNESNLKDVTCCKASQIGDSFLWRKTTLSCLFYPFAKLKKPGEPLQNYNERKKLVHQTNVSKDIYQNL
jgi:hypothetical protein